ncbi:hypothetical protein ACH4GK_34025 [Streptomyces rimosus]|uniref:hypothetical protein n=1 Tax=Streptomyces rimosus TaxID=1927 RepID=UPI0004CC81C4|nr:hypothetical protein [Streptomyces rimosus]
MAAKKGLSWGLAVAMGVMAVSVVVDWGRGEGLDWAVVALLLMVGPHAAGEVLRAYGRDRAAARTAAVSNWLVFPAGVVLWAGLIVGWSRGEGTPWLPFAAAVLIPLGAAVMGVAALRRRRAAA